MPNTIQNNATGNAFIDGIVNGSHWSQPQITYGFTTSSSDYESKYGLNEPTKGYTALTAQQANATKQAINAWAELINLQFVQTSGKDAEIRVAASSAPKTAWTYMPGAGAEAGDVWLGTASNYYGNPKIGNYAFDTILHELGHALGLSHPTDGTSTVGSGNFAADDGTAKALCPCCAGLTHGMVNGTQALVNEANAAQAAGASYFGGSTASNTFDAMAYTVMSYSSYAGDSKKGYTNGTWDYAQSPMLRDIAAVQSMYGANFATRSGDTVYSWNPTTGEKLVNGVSAGAPGGNKVFEAIWDGGGHDTINLSAYTSNLSIDLNPGGWTNFGNSQLANLGGGQVAPGNVAMAYLYQGDQRSLIENATGGSGNDVIKGNVANNILIGGTGNDKIDGQEGNNVLVGGTLNNELALVSQTSGASGPATTQSTGNDGNDTLIGGSGFDICIPGSGKNVVDGGAGTDVVVIDRIMKEIKVSQSGGSVVLTYGTDSATCTNIEYLATKDGVFKFGGMVSTETKIDISLLYSASLGRAIDKSGLNYWADVISEGKTVSNVAAALIASDEFKAHYGNPKEISNAEFIHVLYENVLHREADSAGAAYWMSAMDHGKSHADVLMSMAFSGENRSSAQLVDSGTAEVSLIAVDKIQWPEFWA